MKFSSLRAVDSNGVNLDANGNPVFPVQQVLNSPVNTDTNPLAALLTSAANAAGQYATAQQTNVGISTLSNVAMAGIVVWGLVKVFGK